MRGRLWYRPLQPDARPETDRLDVAHLLAGGMIGEPPAGDLQWAAEAPSTDYHEIERTRADEVFTRTWIDNVIETAEKTDGVDDEARRKTPERNAKELAARLIRIGLTAKPESRYAIDIEAGAAYHPRTMPRRSRVQVEDRLAKERIRIQALGPARAQIQRWEAQRGLWTPVPCPTEGLARWVAWTVDGAHERRGDCPQASTLVACAEANRRARDDSSRRMVIDWRNQAGEERRMIGTAGELLAICAGAFHTCTTSRAEHGMDGWVLDLIERNGERCQLRWDGQQIAAGQSWSITTPLAGPRDGQVRGPEVQRRVVELLGTTRLLQSRREGTTPETCAILSVRELGRTDKQAG